MVTEARRICVTGAAGQTGRHTLRSLSKHAEQFALIAGIYSAEKSDQESYIKEHCPSAQVCLLDADDIDSCVEAFKNVSDLFIIPSSSEAKVRHAFNYIRAAKKAKVPFVVVLSISGSETRDYLWADQFWSIEEEVKRAGLDSWCILRSSFYLQNLLLYAEQYSQGYVPLPIGREGKFAPIDVYDVGEAAASILINSRSHKNKTYTVTGPDLLSGDDIATAFYETINQDFSSVGKLEWRDISRPEAQNILMSSGVPHGEVQGLIEFYQTVKSRGVKFEQRSDDFKQLIGREPNSIRDWLKRIKGTVLEKMKQYKQQFSQPASSQPQVA